MQGLSGRPRPSRDPHEGRGRADGGPTHAEAAVEVQSHLTYGDRTRRRPIGITDPLGWQGKHQIHGHLMSSFHVQRCFPDFFVLEKCSFEFLLTSVCVIVWYLYQNHTESYCSTIHANVPVDQPSSHPNLSHLFSVVAHDPVRLWACPRDIVLESNTSNAAGWWFEPL